MAFPQSLTDTSHSGHMLAPLSQDPQTQRITAEDSKTNSRAVVEQREQVAGRMDGTLRTLPARPRSRAKLCNAS